MARLTTGQKAQRVLRFLSGLRNPRIVTPLAAFGFSQTDVDEGWDLLRATIGARLTMTTARRVDASVYDELDAWENRWFPVADASLRRHFPAAHAWLFLNLRQTEGLEVVISVGTFLSRVAKLSDAEVEQGSAARELLQLRGLTAENLAQVQQLLDGTQVVEFALPPEDPTAKEASAAAEEALWNWYLEWSQLARVAVRQPALLRELGFGLSKSSRSGGSDAGDDADGESDDELDDGGVQQADAVS